MILDCYELFRDCKGDEVETRQAFDEMRWGLVKWEAVKTICSLNEELSWQSYFLTNLRFHSRWTGLNEPEKNACIAAIKTNPHTIKVGKLGTCPVCKNL